MYEMKTTQVYNIYEMMRSPDMLPAPMPLPKIVNFYGGQNYNSNDYKTKEIERSQKERKQKAKERGKRDGLDEKVTDFVTDIASVFNIFSW